MCKLGIAGHHAEHPFINYLNRKGAYSMKKLSSVKIANRVRAIKATSKFEVGPIVNHAMTNEYYFIN